MSFELVGRCRLTSRTISGSKRPTVEVAREFITSDNKLIYDEGKSFQLAAAYVDM
jgi:hypothetical protein